MERAPHFVDTYKRYKGGTKHFVQWLAETARATGTVNSLFDDPTPKPSTATSGGRLKGKARKQQRKAEENCSSAKPHRILIKHLRPLATAVVNTAHVCIPHDIFTILRSIIRDRKQCAAWYHFDPRPETSSRDDDASHWYFIQVLQDVLAILKPKEPSQTKSKAREEHPLIIRQPGTYSSFYQAIKVEDDDESLARSDSHPPFDATNDALEDLRIDEAANTQPDPPQKSADDAQAIDYEIESTKWDVFIALHLMLKDALKLRAFFQRTWREFSRGEIGLEAASQTMNVSIWMIKELSDQFLESFPQFSGTKEESMHRKIVNFVHATPMFKRCEEEMNPFLGRKMEDLVLSQNDSDQPFVPSTMMCHQLLNVLEHYGLSGPERGSTSNWGTIDDNIASILLRTIIGMVVTPSDFRWRADESSNAIRLMGSHSCTDTWVVLALQMLWDAQFTLGSRLECAVKILQEATQQMSAGYEKYVCSLDSAPPRADFKIIKTRDIYTKWLEDMRAVKRYTAVYTTSSGANDNSVDKCFSWSLSMNPLLCGTTLAEMRRLYEYGFVGFASDRLMVLSAAHLYNAIGTMLELDKRYKWPDMEWFIDQQGSERLFLDSDAKSGITLMNKYMLALGVSLSDVQKLKKKSKNGVYGAFDIQATRSYRHLRCLVRHSELDRQRLKDQGKNAHVLPTHVLATMVVDDQRRSQGGTTELSCLNSYACSPRASKRASMLQRSTYLNSIFSACDSCKLFLTRKFQNATSWNHRQFWNNSEISVLVAPMT